MMKRIILSRVLLGLSVFLMTYAAAADSTGPTLFIKRSSNFLALARAQPFACDSPNSSNPEYLSWHTSHCLSNKIQPEPRFYDSNNGGLKDWQRNLIIAFAVIIFAASILLTLYRYRKRQQSKGRDIEMSRIHVSSPWDRPNHDRGRGRGPMPAPFPARTPGRERGRRGERNQTPPPPYSANPAS